MSTILIQKEYETRNILHPKYSRKKLEQKFRKNSNFGWQDLAGLFRIPLDNGDEI
ncbi:MAG: hypothetical protein OEM21_03465 [Nitrosopumilus sp.]|nr:hypothetical protein [Nitrosopumilus sp.]